MDGGEVRAGAAEAKTSRMAQWQRFGQFIKHLNRQAAQEAPEGSRYVVLYMGRHGEGCHNVAERLYGTEEWDVRVLLFILVKVICAKQLAIDERISFNLRDLSPF